MAFQPTKRFNLTRDEWTEIASGVSELLVESEGTDILVRLDSELPDPQNDEAHTVGAGAHRSFSFGSLTTETVYARAKRLPGSAIVTKG
ncbi:hypothetical protein [Aureimonas sp. AU40]|uniref:hypothetical protein n=1 Tax=Aureimonas sp. AU40 TaxID=1637747 RepID=UPI000AAF8336|nr:hypothetical protein [Aureimonas sp. AU40]